VGEKKPWLIFGKTVTFSTLEEGMRAEQTRKNIKRFFGTQLQKTQPRPDGSNASGWYRRSVG